MESKAAPKTASQTNIAPPGYESSGIRESLCLRVWVPDEQVGRVIGKKGAIVHHLQEETGTTVTLIPNLTDSAWHPISIRGEFGKVRRALDMIASLVDEIDDVVMEFPFSRAHCLKLREAAGKNSIPFISATHKTRINVPDNGEPRANVQLEGAIENVCRTFESLLLVAILNNTEVNRPTAPAFTYPRSADASSSTPVKSSGDDGIQFKKKKGKKSASEATVTNEVADKKGVLIPSTIVGLLLIRNITTKSKAKPKANVLSLIQYYTSTVISKDESNKNESENDLAQNGTEARKPESQEPVLFWVSGQTKAMVELASQSLEKIVAGERINAVLKELEEFHQR